MKHLDLFSGYGGFTISAQKIGWETVNFSEIDKYANAVLRYRFPKIQNLGDVTKIKGEDLPAVDIITGGTPCQDLSVAGKGAGLNGKRSGLFFHFIRLIKEKQPTYFVWENVKGALSSNRGWDFARVQIEMEQAGYDVWWQVINAKDFGVPQNRERVFAIGVREGSGREILFERVDTKQNTKTTRRKLSSRNFGSSGSYHKPEEISSTLTQSMGTGGNNVPMTSTQRVVIPTQLGNSKNFGNCIGENSVFTLRASNPNGIIENTQIRRLTPTECERLMGLPDGWTAKGIIDGKEINISDTQRYRMCGNGVVINCVDYIYKLLKENK